jgi:hypothetical protein
MQPPGLYQLAEADIMRLPTSFVKRTTAADYHTYEPSAGGDRPVPSDGLDVADPVMLSRE